MFKNELLSVLHNYSTNIHDYKAFRNILKDLYPQNTLEINLVMTAHEAGIIEAIEKVHEIDSYFVSRLTEKMIKEYGTDRNKALAVVELWCECYGQDILGKKNSYLRISSVETKIDNKATYAIINSKKSNKNIYKNNFTLNILYEKYGILVSDAESWLTVRQIIYKKMRDLVKDNKKKERDWRIIYYHFGEEDGFIHTFDETNKMFSLQAQDEYLLYLIHYIFRNIKNEVLCSQDGKVFSLEKTWNRFLGYR